jgi:uncharacterized membrane protein
VSDGANTGTLLYVSTLPDLPTGTPRRRYAAGAQLGGSAAAGIVVGLPLAAALGWSLAPILAWDLAAVVYLLWVWLTIWRLDAEATAEAALPEDPTRAISDMLTIAAALVSLIAVGFVIGQASTEKGVTQILLAALGIASVAVSWAVVHTVFTLRYARLYYMGSDGGVDFKTDDPPRYSDFAYLAFTIGMTFQVSDTDLTDNSFRRLALRHALLSYVFGAGILATTINLVANL